ncbi:MAG TPA: polymer-forming cytoskeletal protein [Gemmatimonadales bacterium]|nr:polymer-forming cytoskeletal protein [Gemmatimonadales bacterium]
MKFATLAMLALLLGASGSAAAQTADTLRPAAIPADQALENALRLRDESQWLGVPDVTPQPGPIVVQAGDSVAGPLAVSGGLEVLGTVTGDAVVYGGDLLVGESGVVTGRAIALAGEVFVAPGATVQGDVTSIVGSVAPAAQVRTGGERTRHMLVLVLAWLAIVVSIGVGLLVFAGSHLETVAETLITSVGRSFLVGVAGQLAIIPLLLLGIVALAITILGVLLIPIAIVTYTIAVAGLLMLGFLASARLIGGAIGPSIPGDSQGLERRRYLLRSLLIGILILFLPWLVVGALMSMPAAASMAYGVAWLMTWVAVTAGFGASIRSRAGRRSLAVKSTAEELSPADTSWQTPTPVGGVAAARRPTPASSSRSSE